jgi:hypothetical protein
VGWVRPATPDAIPSPTGHRHGYQYLIIAPDVITDINSSYH